MDDIAQLVVMGFGLFMLVFYRGIRSVAHGLRVLVRAMRKEFGTETKLTPEVRTERQPENIS
jgi:hypothetical protein